MNQDLKITFEAFQVGLKTYIKIPDGTILICLDENIYEVKEIDKLNIGYPMKDEEQND